jgi:hypothetical protein
MSLTGFLENHLFQCSVKALTGFECPGCGMQRAFIALLKGEFMLSLQLNASMVPFLLTLLYVTLHLLFKFRNGARAIVWMFSFTVAVMLVNFILKLLQQL